MVTYVHHMDVLCFSLSLGSSGWHYAKCNNSYVVADGLC